MATIRQTTAHIRLMATRDRQTTANTRLMATMYQTDYSKHLTNGYYLADFNINQLYAYGHSSFPSLLTRRSVLTPVLGGVVTTYKNRLRSG